MCSPLPPPEILPQHPQHLPVANGDKARVVADHLHKSASFPQRRAKHAGGFVAQLEFIRIVPATPDALSLLECCGVADKSAFPGATD